MASTVAPSESRLVRLASLLWGLAFLAIVLRLVLSRPGSHTVYPIFVQAARDWLSGRAIYGGEGGLFRYGPFLATFFIPLSYLPDRMGEIVWRGLNLALFLLAFRLWNGSERPRPLDRAEGALAAILVIPNLAFGLQNGQSNPMVISLLLVGAWGARRERWNMAALALAGATLLKIYPAAFALLLAGYAPWRFLPRYLLACGLGLLVPFLLQATGFVVEQYLAWWNLLRGDFRMDVPFLHANRDLWLLLRRADLAPSVQVYRTLQLLTLAGLVGLGWSSGRSGRSGPGAADPIPRGLRLSVVWMMVLGPATEASTYVLLAPLVVVDLVLGTRARPIGLAQASLVASGGLLFVADVVNLGSAAASVHSFGPQPLAAMAYLLYLALTTVQAVPAEEGRGPGSPSVSEFGEDGNENPPSRAA